MKITLGQLKQLIREQVEEMAASSYEVLILQDRDQFTDMLGGGSYYENAGWPDELDDPNVVSHTFDSETGAREFAEKKLEELEELLSDDTRAPSYRAIISKIGPRGKKTFIDEMK